MPRLPSKNPRQPTLGARTRITDMNYGPLFDKTLSDPKGLRQVRDTSEGGESPTCCGFENRHEENAFAQDFSKSDFDGVTYERKFDATRLRGEMARVYAIMKRGKWLTLCEISDKISESSWRDGYHRDPEASISARLRDLRKARFGAHTVERRRRGNESRGLFEYRLL